MKQLLSLSVLDEIVFNAFLENTVKSVKRVNKDCYIVYDVYDVYATFRLYYSKQTLHYHTIDLQLFNSCENIYKKIITAISKAEIVANERLGGQQ